MENKLSDLMIGSDEWCIDEIENGRMEFHVGCWQEMRQLYLTHKSFREGQEHVVQSMPGHVLYRYPSLRLELGRISVGSRMLYDFLLDVYIGFVEIESEHIGQIQTITRMKYEEFKRNIRIFS